MIDQAGRAEARSGDDSLLPAAVVLAAGKGTRMRSRHPKVLHQVAGRAMLWHVLAALQEAGIPTERTTIVVGEQAAAVRAAVESWFGAGRYRFARQAVPLGTAHAVLQAQDAVPSGARTIVVAYGDTPLLQGATVSRLLEQHRASGAVLTLAAGYLDDPSGYGRLVRGEQGELRAVVEERDATAEQRAIHEVNSGFCAFDAAWLWQHLPCVPVAPNGERYLPALAGMAVAAGDRVATLVLDDVMEALGVNTRAALAEAEATLRRRIATRLMEAGVTLQDPASTYVDAGVVVGADTVILANTHLAGETIVGSECELGPNTIVRNSVIGDRCRVLASVLDGAQLEDEVTVGPFAHLRPGTRCGRASHVGTGSEIKASSLGPGSRMGHFGYLGDAMVGSSVNLGAGMVTCNFDGQRKHPTRIDDGAFIGSGTMLVAPVHVGAGALTGAGAVVIRDVEPGVKVAGVPARPIGRRDGPAAAGVAESQERGESPG